jgi:RimJ/RimL family protein N-acetyltransferase
VWSTGEANLASQRVAEKLGFTLTARRTYVIPEKP